ncbi:MAG: dTDP-4-dehydrorhamnose 3,5-epimerase [bacterium]|nr:dTDP-4-dehydrorhamnose 3,5-epimerase [bacterium]
MDKYTVTRLALPDVLLISPEVRRDNRGFSVNVYSPTDFAACGIATVFAEDFTSRSKKEVLRGLHFQRAPHAQDKLVRCAKGEIFDVAADCDPSSPTYGQYVSMHLTDKEQKMLYIPGKYAHGFCVMSDEAIVEYKLSDTYHPESVGGARYDDPLFAIEWPITDLILSEQDKSWASLPDKK